MFFRKKEKKREFFGDQECYISISETTKEQEMENLKKKQINEKQDLGAAWVDLIYYASLLHTTLESSENADMVRKSIKLKKKIKKYEENLNKIIEEIKNIRKSK